MSFTVQDKHVVVAGGGRSGIAAAELLVARGARVTLSDSAPVEGAERLRQLGVSVEVGPHREALFTAADLVVLSPGVPPGQHGDRGGATRRRAGHRRDRARVALADRPRGRDHRHEGEVDDDDAGGADAAGSRIQRHRRRQSRDGALVAGAGVAS